MAIGMRKESRAIWVKLRERGYLTIYDVRRILALARGADRSLLGAFDSGRVTDDIPNLVGLYRRMRRFEARGLAGRLAMRPAVWIAMDDRAVLKPEEVLRGALRADHVVAGEVEILQAGTRFVWKFRA